MNYKLLSVISFSLVLASCGGPNESEEIKNSEESTVVLENELSIEDQWEIIVNLVKTKDKSGLDKLTNFTDDSSVDAWSYLTFEEVEYSDAFQNATLDEVLPKGDEETSLMVYFEYTDGEMTFESAAYFYFHVIGGKLMITGVELVG